MPDLGTLVLGTFDSGNSTNTAVSGTEPALQAVSVSSDGNYGYDSSNTTHVGVAYFALQDMPGDFGNMEGIAIQLRYALQSGTVTNSWVSLTAQIYESDLLTALTGEVTLATGISNTTPANSSIIPFTSVNSAASPATWDAAVVALRFSISKNKGGDSLEERVFAATLTGSYTASSATNYDRSPAADKLMLLAWNDGLESYLSRQSSSLDSLLLSQSDEEQSLRQLLAIDGTLFYTNAPSLRRWMLDDDQTLLGDSVDAFVGAVIVTRSQIDGLMVAVSDTLERAHTFLSTLALSDARYSAVEKTMMDMLLTSSRLYSLLRDILATSSLFLLDSAQTDLGALQAQRTALDNLILSDSSSIERELRALDRLLVEVKRYSELARTNADALEISDSATIVSGLTEIYRTALDAVLFYSSAPMKARQWGDEDKMWLDDSVSAIVNFVAVLRAVIDTILIEDQADIAFANVVVRQAIDRILANDPSLTRDTDILSFIDEIGIDDRSTRWKDLNIRSAAEIVDDLISQLSLQLRDRVYFTDLVDALVGVGLTLRQAVDGLMLLSDSSRARSVTQFDSLFVTDNRISDVARNVTSALLVGDNATMLFAAERRVIDGVFLAVSVVRALEKVHREGIDLIDSAAVEKSGEIIRFAIDALMLFDVISTSPKLVAYRDGLLFSDATFRELVRTWMSSLLVSETRTSALEKSLLDAMQFYDTAATAKLAGLIRQATDGLVLSETILRSIEAQHRDTALLNDASLLGSELAREYIDRMFMLDTRAVGRGITRLDALALDAIANRLRETLVRDDVLTPDYRSGMWFPVVLEFITWAHLSAVQVLGIRTSAVQVLGIRTFARDPLHRVLGASKWRVNG